MRDMIGFARPVVVLGLLALGAGIAAQLAPRIHGILFGYTGPAPRPIDTASRTAAELEPTGISPGAAKPMPGALLPRLVQAGGFARIETEPIWFHTGEPDMHSESIGALDRLAAFLVMQPAIRLRIVGHTDDRGPEWANDAVSAERAASVRDYLIGRGVAARRLAAEGKGSREPVAPNDTAAGRRRNRRIEFLVVRPK